MRAERTDPVIGLNTDILYRLIHILIYTLWIEMIRAESTERDTDLQLFLL